MARGGIPEDDMAMGERGPAPELPGRAGPAGPQGLAGSPGPDSTPDLKAVTKTRTSFPESWIWADAFVG